MSPAEQVRISTEPGPLGWLAWATVSVATVLASAVLTGDSGPALIAAHPVAFGALACALIVLAILFAACDVAPVMEQEDEMRDAYNHDTSHVVESYHLPHMNNQPNDARL